MNAMSEVAPQPRFYTPEEYFAFEDAATERHEYFDGRIIAMSVGPEAVLRLESLQIDLRAADVYADVIFPDVPDIGPQPDETR